MKPLLLVLLFAGFGATGLSLAQNHIDISNTNGHTSITIRCDQEAVLCDQILKRTKRPPAPPAPPTPPSPPGLSELPDVPEYPEIPEPPEPPPPPKVVIPKQVHRACEGKKDGQEAQWRVGKQSYYAGICRQQQGAMQLDVHRIELNQNDFPKTRP
ncbi:MAG: hypothetical protein HY253_07495 [Burkholderiales bacterium]|nr:hypothetical protein [Burkholderiales bacterium]